MLTQYFIDTTVSWCLYQDLSMENKKSVKTHYISWPFSLSVGRKACVEKADGSAHAFISECE